jgi:hypothetical protein
MFWGRGWARKICQMIGVSSSMAIRSGLRPASLAGMKAVPRSFLIKPAATV